MPARYSDLIRADGPSLYWRHGEGAQGRDSLTGIPIRDASGNGRDGTIVNTVYSWPGALWGAPQPDFNGSALFQANGYITSGYSPFAASSARTFALWLYRFNWGTNETIFGGDGSGAPPLLRFNASADTLDFHSQAGSSVQWAAPVRMGWSHLVLRRDKANDRVALTIDGRLLGWQTLTLDYQATPGNLVVSAWSDAYFDPFYGAISEFAVWEGLLTDEQIRAHYDAGRARNLVFNGSMDGPAAYMASGNSWGIAGWEDDVPGGSTLTTFAQSQAWAWEGSNSLLMDVTVPGTGGPHWPNARSRNFRVHPGHHYTASAIVNVTTATASGAPWLQMIWFAADGSWLSADDGPMGSTGTGVQALSLKATAPAGARSARVSVPTTCANGERLAIHIDDVRVADASSDAAAAPETAALMRLA